METIDKKTFTDFRMLVRILLVLIFCASSLSMCHSCNGKNESQRISRELLKDVNVKDSLILKFTNYIIELERYNAAVEAENTVLKSQLDKNHALMTSSLTRPTAITVRVPEQPKTTE